jgi:tetratricopeptide (TPR) repeat protein
MFETIRRKSLLFLGALVCTVVVPSIAEATGHFKYDQQSKGNFYAQSYYDLWSELREFNQRERARQNELARMERIRQAKQSARASIPELEKKKDYLALGRAWRTLEEWDKGLDAAEKVIAAYPNMVSGYTLRASLRKKINDIAGALADYDRVVAIEPNFFDNYRIRGELKKSFDRHGAIQDFRMAMKLVRVDSNYNLIRDSELRAFVEELRSLGATEKETF